MSYTGAINGLLVNSDHLNILSNNIANASTIGFKSSTPVFYNIVPSSFYSQNTTGSGVGTLKNIQNFKDGTFIDTGRDLDLKITRDGFFRVLDKQGYVHYTRNGQFLLDKDKNLVSVQGMYLTGRNKCYSKNKLNNTHKLEPINLKHADILRPKATSTITLSAILNGSVNVIENIRNPNQNSAKKYHITVYNKNEKSEKINIFFNKIDKNTWKVNISLNDTNSVGTKENADNSFILKFDANGKLTSNPIFSIKNNNSNETIALNLSGTTEQSNIDESWHEFYQDGYPKGSLKTFEILSNGEIIGTYSNEQIQEIGQIILSKFVNPEKLQPESGNLWSATEESGKENIGMASDIGFGILNTKTLEASNVDLNKELINMIVAQRNYQSTAQAFKAEDKAINTLINLR